jgi:hypothetical protein
MAIFALTDGFIQINGVTLSDHANQVTVEDTRDTIDITAFGATSKAVTKGLGDAKITSALPGLRGRQDARDAAAADRVVDAGDDRGPRDVSGPVGDEPCGPDERAADGLQHAGRGGR